MPAYGAPPQALDTSKAVLSMVLGIVGILFAGLLTGIPAIIIGSRARKAIRAGQAGGDGMALAGVILGWIATVFSALAIVLVVVFVIIAVTSSTVTSP
jgi:hypothetical protein